MQPIPDACVCQICKAIAHQPTKCSHCKTVYCKSCIEKKHGCPDCKKSGGVNKFESLAADQQLIHDSLDFSCPECRTQVKYKQAY